MLEEVIWVSGAAQEYLEANPKLASAEAIDALIELIKLFPDIGSKVNPSKRIQKDKKQVKGTLKGTYISNHMDKTLRMIEKYLELNRRPKSSRASFESIRYSFK